MKKMLMVCYDLHKSITDLVGLIAVMISDKLKQTVGVDSGCHKTSRKTLIMLGIYL